MSLFKTKELWSAPNPPNETFCARSLALFPSETLIASRFKSDLILTASLEGTLRLFHVILNQEGDSEAAKSLLLETNLKMTILQVAVGKFSR